MIEAAVVMILLHGPGGREIRVNPQLVTSMHAGKPNTENKLFTDEVRCVVMLVDGKFVSVVETCSEVEQMLEAAK